MFRRLKFGIAVIATGLVLAACGSPSPYSRVYPGSPDDLREYINSRFDGSALTALTANGAKNVLNTMAVNDQADLIAVMLELGAPVDYIEPGESQDRTPLMFAIANRSTNTINLLLANGADINRTNSFRSGIFDYIAAIKRARQGNPLTIGGIPESKYRLGTMQMAYELGNRSFVILQRSEDLAGSRYADIFDPAKAIDVGPHGAMVYAEMRGYPQLVEALRQIGVRPRNFSGAQTASLESYRTYYAQQREAAQNQNRANRNRSGGNGAGLFAGLAILAGAGYLASEGAGAQAVQFLTAGMTDVLSDGSGNNLANLNNQLNAQAGSGSGGNGGSGGEIAPAQATATVPEQNYSFSCPNTGANYTILITGQSPQCREAQRKYGVAASCNMIDSLESLQRNYYSVCAGEIYGD